MNADPLSGLTEQMTFADLSIELPIQVNRMLRLWSNPSVVVAQRVVRKRWLCLILLEPAYHFVMKSARVRPAFWRFAQIACE
jgi:hypothetical protein